MNGIISEREFQEFSEWFARSQAPARVQKIFHKFSKLHTAFLTLSRSNRNLLARLREAMGLTPKSEKGSQLNQSGGVG